MPEVEIDQQCDFTTAAGMRCLLDANHYGGHDPVGDDLLINAASYAYDLALSDYEGALGSRDPARRETAERALREATRTLSQLQHRRVMARKWRNRRASAPTWDSLLYDPTQQLDRGGVVLAAVLSNRPASEKRIGPCLRPR